MNGRVAAALGIFLLAFLANVNPLLTEEWLTILALGDSTTAGTPGFRSPVEAPPNGSGNEQSQYAYWMMKRHPHWRVLNRGVNGERSDQILRRFKKDLPAIKPQWVIVLGGVNDLYQGVPIEWVKKNLQAIFDLALKERVRVMACTILPYNTASARIEERRQEVNDWIRSYAEQRGLGFCDTAKVVEDPSRPGRLLGSPDGLHPDVEGYRRMAEALTESVEKGFDLPSNSTLAKAARFEPTARFKPAWWARGPHAQTIWGSLPRITPPFGLKRERWETPDGDFIDLDRLSGPPGSPILVVLHGLEGSSRSGQVLGLLRAATLKGWSGLGVNFRSCSGQINRLRRSYHGGETSDLSWIIQRLLVEQPERKIFLAGVSLGGNVLLKYLGEEGEALPEPILAAVAISAPFDLAQSAQVLEVGFGRFYMKRLVQSMRRKTLKKMKIYPDLADVRKVRSARTLAQFDDAVTAPVHGFQDAQVYWAASSSKEFLTKIRRPTLLINARDDPFLPEAALPEAAVAGNPFLRALFSSRGGHVGFLSGNVPGWPIPWAEIQAMAFLEEKFKRTLLKGTLLWGENCPREKRSLLSHGFQNA